MDVPRDALVELLELQKVDSAVDRLEARRKNLPEQVELETLEERLTELEKELGEQQAVVDEIAVRQRRLDHEIDSLRAKMAGEEAKLYSGTIGNPKELEDLRREIEALKRRVSTLEDMDLEVMEELEAAEKGLHALQAETGTVREAIEEATVLRDRASAEVKARLEAARDERSVRGPRIDPELLRLYEDIRAAKGGVGAAALVDGVCQGCHMRLPAQEYERVRHAEGLVRCDECRRILIVLPAGSREP